MSQIVEKRPSRNVEKSF